MIIINASKTRICKNKILIFGAAFSLIVLLVATAVVVVVLKKNEIKHELYNHWNYYEQEKWSGLCISGEFQSPITLSDIASNKSLIPSLNFQHVGYFEKIEVANDGHSVTVRLDNCNCSRPTLSGGGLPGNFTLDNVHFHWPSEHTIEGLQYELEGHFVFFGDEYENLQKALEYPYGVTVVAVLFSESNMTKHDNFKVIDDEVKQIFKQAGESRVSSRGIIFSDFFPEDKETFFKYTGSLTTPDCVENINWIVYKKTSSISNEDLMDLIHIYTEDNELLESNNRMLQDINERTIYLRSASR